MAHGDRIMVIAGLNPIPSYGAGTYSGIPRCNVSRISSVAKRVVENARHEVFVRGYGRVMTITRASLVIIFTTLAGAAGAPDAILAAVRLTTP
jgi:hypothetical protein